MSEPDRPRPAREAHLEWRLQIDLLLRLCAERPLTYRLIGLAADGLEDEELIEDMNVSKEAFDELVDDVHDHFRQLSSAFWDHDQMRSEWWDCSWSDFRDLPGEALQALAAIAATLHPRSPFSAERQFRELLESSFQQLSKATERASAEELRSFLAATSRLAGLLREYGGLPEHGGRDGDVPAHA